MVEKYLLNDSLKISISVSVRDLISDPELGLDLKVFRGEAYLENVIRSDRVQKLGMALVGTSGDVYEDRVQIIGGTESDFLLSLEDEERLRVIQRLKKYRVCCIVVTSDAVVPEDLLNLSDVMEVPFIQSSEPGDISGAKISHYLEKKLAPRATMHGCLLAVFGLGVLITGPSGIGKSECALELVLKGHRLVADDCVEITRYGNNRLLGEGGKFLRHHMELRGLGIIDIKELYGISATGMDQDIDFIVRLDRWKADGEYDRLGIEKSSLNLLGVPVTVIDIPVAPGRNVSTLVEVAAKVHLLQQAGYKTSELSN